GRPRRLADPADLLGSHADRHGSHLHQVVHRRGARWSRQPAGGRRRRSCHRAGAGIRAGVSAGRIAPGRDRRTDRPAGRAARPTGRAVLRCGGEAGMSIDTPQTRASQPSAPPAPPGAGELLPPAVPPSGDRPSPGVRFWNIASLSPHPGRPGSTLLRHLIYALVAFFLLTAVSANITSYHNYLFAEIGGYL